MKPLPARLATLLACAAAACAPHTPAPIDEPIPAGESFLAIPHPASASAVAARRQALGNSPLQPGEPEDFYLAIHKKELGERWLLSSYAKQFFPGAVAYGAARSLAVTVVRFKIQNGKLFMYNAGDGKAVSDTFTPELILEAWPLVDYAPFARRAGAEDYVLIDTTAGLNRYALVGDAFAGGSPAERFEVEAGYLQRFRKLTDGVTWEHVFVGYGDLYDNGSIGRGETNVFRGSGTLGLALRRYAEDPNYKPTTLPVREHYFRSNALYEKNTGRQTQVAIKWPIYKGMKPIQWVISDQFAKLAADPRYKGYDVVGAVIAGVENWNAAFGFRALEARVARPDESYADDDVNYIVYDADPTYGAAFANWRLNPNTGEIRGASVYINAIWLDTADRNFRDDPTQSTRAPTELRPRPRAPAIIWEPARNDPLCVYWAPPFRDGDPGADVPGGVGEGAALTKKQKVERYVTHVVLHEIGHTLGLRHNFKGSFDPPSSSVMEYVVDDDAVLGDKPGAYDTDAVRYLYGLSGSLPQQPFCTDEDTRWDVDCTRFDRAADPLVAFYTPVYNTFVADYLTGRSYTQPNNSLNNVLKYVRSGSAIQRIVGWNAAVDPVRVGPYQARAAADPDFAARVDVMARNLIRRLYLDDYYLRGDFTLDPPLDPLLLQNVIAELRGNLLNLDGFRTWPTRRAAVDALKRIQTVAAQRALTEAQALLTAARDKLTGDDLAYMDDLLARIRKALDPYFNQ